MQSRFGGNEMTFSRNEIENILKTLPIGYYVKRKVGVTLGDTNASFYNPMEDTITVSYPMIADVMTKCGDSLVEENVRTLLYHEAAHSFLTPKSMRNTEILNIFEDERIESVLRTYFYGVNFREFVKRVNGYDGSTPFTTADQAFYGLVRLRVCEEQSWLDELHRMILKWKHLNRNTDYTRDYEWDVKDFYTRFCEWWNKNKDEKDESGNSESENKSESGDGSQSSGDSSVTSDQENEFSDSSSDGDSTESESESTNGKSEMDGKNSDASSPDSSESVGGTGDAVSTIQSAMDNAEAAGADALLDATFNLDNADLSQKINMILSGIKNFAKKNGSAINAYSGVFDPRAVVRDDCRYFVQKNRLGNVKAFSKTKLNLFIDRSGSFYYNTEKVNQLLKALRDFEKVNPDFSFDLVTMGVGDTLCPKNERVLKCYGGNWLRKDIFDIFNRLQDKNADVHNIVLFDGDAFTDIGYGYTKTSEYKNFRAFNFRNVYIISDMDNKPYITPNCPSAHVTYTRDYTKELFENVLNVLERIAK